MLDARFEISGTEIFRGEKLAPPHERFGCASMRSHGGCYALGMSVFGAQVPRGD